MIEHIQRAMPLFNKSEKRIAKAILDDPSKVLQMSMSELSKYSKTGNATIIRFCQKLNLKGYKEFKLLMAQSCPNLEMRNEKCQDEDEIDKVINTVQDVATRCIMDSAKSLDKNQLEKAAEVIINARKVCCVGLGGSGLSALDTYERFRQIGIDCYGNADPYYQKFEIESLSESDAVIGISYSGQKAVTVDLLKCAKERGATVIGLTGRLGTSMTEYCDIVLSTGIREEPILGGTFITRIAQANVLDILCSLIIIKLAKKMGNSANEDIRKYVEIFY